MKNFFIVIGVIFLFIFLLLMCSPNNHYNQPEVKKLTVEQKQEINKIIKETKNTPENRKLFAKKAQEFMLDEGFDMEFRATGKDYKILECKYVLAGNVLAHKLTKGSFIETVKLESFDKFILKDGFGNRWTWDFKK